LSGTAVSLVGGDPRVLISHRRQTTTVTDVGGCNRC
jgi:hypothetical protein